RKPGSRASRPETRDPRHQKREPAEFAPPQALPRPARVADSGPISAPETRWSGEIDGSRGLKRSQIRSWPPGITVAYGSTESLHDPRGRRLNEIDFRQLRYFVTVAQEGQMTRAARRLQLAQPALSQAMARLEAQVGVRLFER